MDSKDTSRLLTIFRCISLLFIFVQCTFSQPVSTNLFNAKIYHQINGNTVDPIWLRSSVDSDQSNSEVNSSEESFPFLLLNEQNRAGFHSTVRRANFWKRANFWRKRANFWRRDLAA